MLDTGYTYIQKIHRDAVLPSYGTKEAACADICAYLKDRKISLYGGMTVFSEPLPSPREILPIVNDEGVSVIIPPHCRALIPTGLRIKPGYGKKLLVYARSGFPLKTGLLITNSVGTVDADYTGEVGVGLVNTNPFPVKISHDERIAQICLADVIELTQDTSQNLRINTIVLDADVDMTKEFSSARGEKGFGSTGTSALGEQVGKIMRDESFYPDYP